MKTYYTTAFENLIKAGVPKNYIRLHLIGDLIYFSHVYIYYDPQDIESCQGWYATNGISISTEADRNRKCYGDLKSLGFPSWEEYRILFDGDEYESASGFLNAYEQHRYYWLLGREQESRINYTN